MKKIKHLAYLLCCALFIFSSASAYAISEVEHQKVMFLLNNSSFRDKNLSQSLSGKGF